VETFGSERDQDVRQLSTLRQRVAIGAVSRSNTGSRRPWVQGKGFAMRDMVLERTREELQAPSGSNQTDSAVRFEPLASDFVGRFTRPHGMLLSGSDH
jgi:hypothetical protein